MVASQESTDLNMHAGSANSLGISVCSNAGPTDSGYLGLLRALTTHAETILLVVIGGEGGLQASSPQT
jgi:hypothetical protein